jgi:diguanylate cyclase (GGDEF)-like protein/PAS domain S-box-containing protein
MTLALVVPDDVPDFKESWARACRVGGTHSYECRIRRANDGAERLLRSNIEIALSDDGVPVRARGTYMDVTDIDVATRAAKRATAFFDAVLTASPDHTFVTDRATGAIIYGSRSCEILGLTDDELAAVGKQPIPLLAHPDDQDDVRAAEAEAAELDDGQVAQVRYRARHADGGWRWLSRRVTPFRRDAAGRVVELLSVVRDVTDVVEAERLLTHAAMHDHLTGLPNRSLLMQRLDAALERGQRDGREVAVLFCDLDGFKLVNDTGGHAAGDAVLLETARRLELVLRAGDTVARVGGDEFVVIVEPWNRVERGDEPAAVDDRMLAMRVAERIASAMREPIWFAGVPYVVTVSVGIAYGESLGAAESGGLTADEALHAADLAMYRAKDHGKNRYELASLRSAGIPAQRGAAAPVQ